MLTSGVLQKLYCFMGKEGGQISFLEGIFSAYYASEIENEDKQAVEPTWESNACCVFTGQRLIPRNLTKYYLERKTVLQSDVRQFLVTQYRKQDLLDVGREICSWIRASQINPLDQQYLLGHYIESGQKEEQLCVLISEVIWYVIQLKV